MDSRNEIADGRFHAPVIQAGSIGAVQFGGYAQRVEALAGLPADEGFVGRSEQLALLEQVLSVGSGGTAVCVIAGLVGVGKTALAVRAARLAVDAGWFPGGVLFVDLHGYDALRHLDASMALTSLLRALGIAPEYTPTDRGQLEVLYRSHLTRLAERGDGYWSSPTTPLPLTRYFRCGPARPVTRCW